MMTINKQDITKTVLIIWFIAATGYVVYDQYVGYKVRGMQASYQAGYTDSISQLMAQTEKSACQPFEVRKDDTKIQLLNAECLKQAQQQPTDAAKATPAK